MTWFQIHENLILSFPNTTSAYRYALEHGTALKQLKPIKLAALSPRSCLKLFEQILHNLDTGHSLQSALMKQNHLQFGSDLQRHVLAIQCMLAEGQHVARALTIFMPNNIKHLAGCIPLDGTEESKIAALNVAKNILHSQQTLSNKLLKSLVYPFLVIQSSLLLAFMNALLTKQPLLMLATTWLFICLLQISLAIWIHCGHAYPTMCRTLRSLRIYNTLMILVALLQSGEPLQNAVKKLIPTSHKQDKFHLYKCYLLLQAGRPVQHALPSHWFEEQVKTQLEQIHMTGDLITPLTIAASTWQENNERILSLISKAFPILGIVVAAIFVTQTLMALYAPLMDANALGF